MSFVYDVTTDRGKVRRILGDTVDSGHLLEDAEIDFFLTDASSNLWHAAANALDSLANIEARKLSAYSRGAISITRETAQALREQAKQLRAVADSQFTEELVELAYEPFSLQRILFDRVLTEGV